MWKWQEADIKHVHGLDIAESEIAEARERYNGVRLLRQQLTVLSDGVSLAQKGKARHRAQRYVRGHS